VVEGEAGCKSRKKKVVGGAESGYAFEIERSGKEE